MQKPEDLQRLGFVDFGAMSRRMAARLIDRTNLYEPNRGRGLPQVRPSLPPHAWMEIGRSYFQETYPQNLFQECSY